MSRRSYVIAETGPAGCVPNDSPAPHQPGANEVVWSRSIQADAPSHVDLQLRREHCGEPRVQIARVLFARDLRREPKGLGKRTHARRQIETERRTRAELRVTFAVT